MRFYYFIFLFLFFAVENIFSQDTPTSVFHLTKVPPDGVLLDSGWKFIADDKPVYAKPGYDDNKWTSVNPTVDIRRISNSYKSGIGWLRLHLAVDSMLTKEQFVALIDQYVASEFFLNGRLIDRFGVVNSDAQKVIASYPQSPVSLQMEPGHNVIAVRYVAQSNLDFSSIGEDNVVIPLLNIRIISVKDAFVQIRKYERHLPTTNTFRIGASFILAFLYLAFFLYNPVQKAYLFFFLYLAFLVPGDILQISLPSKVSGIISTVRLYYVLWQISRLFLLTALYSLLNQKKGWIYWSFAIAVVFGVLLNNWVFSELILGNLLNLELVRTGFKSLKLKTKGAWIITFGSISFLLLMGAFVIGAYLSLGYWFLPLGEVYIFADLLYGLGSLSIPIATTIYIALNFAFTSQRLKQKLGEVEELSRIKLEQEKEKQQILSSQKEMLEKQVDERTAELKQSLVNLKSAQAQLIQSEKMASLGELTAGIAHEIQNPLNFVNNFSDVNRELVDEAKQEIKNGNIVDADAILNDIKANEEKINHHGKRADAIVKGMLQHSRNNNGVKEPTDINALCDEYLRLAYHGLRAKDKSFNATMKTDFDESIGNINIIPQDIGRVVLNLINNAFYVVDEKKKSGVENYEPTVSVSTKKVNGKVEIRVADNGNGIPQKVLDKIFQPFFTTKPTGQGTGLGLSLSYDIVKAHGGEFKVETKDGEGTIFIFQLPTQDK